MKNSQQWKKTLCFVQDVYLNDLEIKLTYKVLLKNSSLQVKMVNIQIEENHLEQREIPKRMFKYFSQNKLLY
jgi:hypothetical protein